MSTETEWKIIIDSPACPYLIGFPNICEHPYREEESKTNILECTADKCPIIIKDKR